MPMLLGHAGRDLLWAEGTHFLATPMYMPGMGEGEGKDIYRKVEAYIRTSINYHAIHYLTLNDKITLTKNMV